jgi:Bacterial extracellular solute-binding protein/von Willebrand factor type A domain
MGRHSSTAARPGRRSRATVLGVLLVVALVGWFSFDIVRDQLRASGCESRTPVTVTAAPDIAPIVAQLARRAVDDDGACYELRVNSRESAAVAESLALFDGTERPDVWIPESTLWLGRAQDTGAWNVPVTGTSIASSPVVLAVPETVATELGWPSELPAWEDVIGPEAGALRVGFPDPTRDPVGVSALLGLRNVVAGTSNPQAASTAAMRGLSRNTVPRQPDLYAQLPGATMQDPLDAFPTSENALLRHNLAQDRMPLIALYATPAVPALDYPYVVLPGTPNRQRAAGEWFLDRLLTQEGSDLLADAGFRTPDGTALRDRSGDRRTSGTRISPVPPPDAVEVEQVLNAWAGVNLSGRLQVLLDVSGSMDERVPGTGLSRMAVTIQAATAGLRMFKPATKLGMWLYSTDLDGTKDYRELLPVRSMSDHLAGGALDTLRAVEALPNGNTALYDAVLAAYQDSSKHWEPGRINAVVVMTDGKDDNASELTREQLLAELGQLQNPRRPLKIIGIGIGPDVDPAELTAIAEATGGRAFIAPDPTTIGDVFIQALSLMLCQPPACQPEVGG